MKENLLNAAGLNDKARKVTLRGKEVIVPLKFDEDGNPATVDRLIFKRLSLTDLRFLKVLRDVSWDVDKAAKEIGMAQDVAVRLVKKLACFREEDARVRALAEIPTPDWIKAKDVQSIYEDGKLNDSQHKSLDRLAKVTGAFKTTEVTTQINVFNLPALDPAKEAKLKEVFDTLAEDTQNVA